MCVNAFQIRQWAEIVIVVIMATVLDPSHVQALCQMLCNVYSSHSPMKPMKIFTFYR